MTYFPDLSDYTYLPQRNPMLTIGWLDRDHAFTTGPVPPQVIAALTTLAAHQHNITRGVHNCHFCDEESPLKLPADVPRGYVSLGMGEFHVRAPTGITYSAPSLVIHYILQHDYQPPSEFIDAVLHGQPCPLNCS